MGIAGQPRRFFREDIVLEMGMHQSDTGIVECHVDELTLSRTLPFDHRHQNADRGE